MVYLQLLALIGDIKIELFYQEVPGTMGNFVGLSLGKIENKVKGIGIPCYDGLKFHRVINDFMIQAGCPLGTGTGDQGINLMIIPLT